MQNQSSGLLHLQPLQISHIFDNMSPHLNWMKVYCNLFDAIPNVMTLDSVDIERAYNWINRNLEIQIVQKFTHMRLGERRKFRPEDAAFVLTDRTMICISSESFDITVYFLGSVKFAEQLILDMKHLQYKKPKHSLFVVTQRSHGLYLAPVNLKKSRINIASNYNDDLLEVDKFLIETLSSKDDCGLVLLHGIPGTGKSTYISHIIHRVKKRAIFLSPNIAKAMDQPDLQALLLENKNSLIIIEDAEDLLVSRSVEGNRAISTLLNLTEGLLGHGLGIQFICTFNSDVQKIDNALLRKGRLKLLYEFKPLTTEKSTLLLKDLGHDKVATEPMTLADIYGFTQQSFAVKKPKPQIGFSVKAA